jgi:hypothetical protein
MNNDGSRRLVHAAAKAGAAAMREREFIEAEEDARSERAKRLNLAQYFDPYRRQRAWPDAHHQLLGTRPDDVVAELLGTTQIQETAISNRPGC